MPLIKAFESVPYMKFKFMPHIFATLRSCSYFILICFRLLLDNNVNYYYKNNYNKIIKNVDFLEGAQNMQLASTKCPGSIFVAILKINFFCMHLHFSCKLPPFQNLFHMSGVAHDQHPTHRKG